ncbi:MscL family protein [Bradyrhizobium cenepequi]|uniref:MscL family protein n=1 Tax=Bradyrhizobium cenepequi TaxID=2821403 RepID=UPI001CE25B09|nr:MscL family protein [Bradyrhizobium cenepequi]MCA6109793.1 MscL family protein [Bradyrhizobium cenepequi]
MFEGLRKSARRGGAVDGTIGIIAGGAFGVIVSSMVSDLITVVVAFVVIGVLKQAARTLRAARTLQIDRNGRPVYQAAEDFVRRKRKWRQGI